MTTFINNATEDDQIDTLAEKLLLAGYNGAGDADMIGKKITHAFATAAAFVRARRGSQAERRRLREIAGREDVFADPL
jgi:hypothetical protein